MSFIQFQQRCKDCKVTWNAAFGIVGMTQIATPPTKCPECQSENIEKFANGWNVRVTSKPAGETQT